MAPHLTGKEIDFINSNRKLEPKVVHEKLVKQRTKKRMEAPTLRNLRKILKGETYRRGVVETRGRKEKLTRRNVQALDKARKNLIEDAESEDEVHWDDVIKAARVPKVHSKTARNAMQKAGLDVKWRNPRQKPYRSAKDKLQRKNMCKKLAAKPLSYFTEKIDLYMDNKTFAIPTTPGAKAHLKMTKVRGHLRTRSEGLSPGFTKPNNKRHRKNPGDRVQVCAGIINDQIKIWHYLPSTWNGEVAEETYRGPIISALRRHRGVKRSYSIVEDNDPTGYKSRRAVAAKMELGIKPIDYPKYSPDLNPLDYFVWSEVDRRMGLAKVTRVETKAQYMARLRRTALSIPKATMAKAVAQMKRRASDIADAKGGNIKID